MYNNDKGRIGEQSVAEFLNEIFDRFGYTFFRVGGIERRKNMFPGDVCLDFRDKRNKSTNCILNDYFIEVKRQGTISFWADTAKARDDARSANKRGYILFAQLQPRGEKVAGRELVVMDKSTLKALLVELQGYREEDATTS